MAEGEASSGNERREQVFFLNPYGTLQADPGEGLVGDCFTMLAGVDGSLQLANGKEVLVEQPAVVSVEAAGTTADTPATTTTLRAVTLPDGTQAFMPEELTTQQDIEAETLQLEDGSAVFVQQLPKVIRGHEIKLQDGSSAFVPSESTEQVETFQPVELEDGTVAYISLTSNSMINAASLGLQTLLVRTPDEEETTTVMADSAADPPPAQKDEEDEDEDELCVKDRSKGFVCPYRGCRKSYYTLHHLKVHERTHTGDRPFRCPQSGCDKAFATGYGRKAHVRTHTGEKPYKCPEDTCGKRFKTSGDLQKHVRTHTGERPFRCPVAGCDRSFTTSNIRKVHVRTHTGERPYVCPQEGCTRAFASATNYKNHLRIHSGEKPYVCTMQGCGKRFTEYSSLYKHHMVHTQQKPYFCMMCARHYRQASTLTMHKRTVHGIVEAEDGTEIIFGDTVLTLANNFAGAKKLGGNVLGFSKDGSTFLALETSDDSNDHQNSHSQFLVVSDPAQLATLEELGVTGKTEMVEKLEIAE